MKNPTTLSQIAALLTLATTGLSASCASMDVLDVRESGNYSSVSGIGNVDYTRTPASYLPDSPGDKEMHDGPAAYLAAVNGLRAPFVVGVGAAEVIAPIFTGP